MRNLINSGYDAFLKKTGKGELYDVIIQDSSDDTAKDVVVSVWAKSEAEAGKRALDQVASMKYEANEHLKQHSDNAESTLLKKTIKFPFFFWKTPIYKKAVDGAINPSGYRSGAIVKLSIKDLRQTVEFEKNKKNYNDLSKKDLAAVLKVNIFSTFVWAGLIVFGVVFLLLAVSGNESTFVFSWLSPYVIAGFACFGVGGLYVYQSVRDYFRIIHKLEDMDRNESREGGTTDD